MIELNEKEQKWVDEIFEKLDKKLSVTAVKLRGRIPYSTKDGFYPDMDYMEFSELVRRVFVEVNEEIYRKSRLCS